MTKALLFLLGLVVCLSIFLINSEMSYLDSCCPRGGTPPPPTQKGPGIVQPPTPAANRPPLGIGLQPLIQSLQFGQLASVVEPWEIWWSRNREKYLSFRAPIEWIKVVDSGGTQSVSIYPIYDELIKILEQTVVDKDHYLAFRAAISLGKVQDSQNPKIASQRALKALKSAHGTETRFFVTNNILLALGLTGESSCADIIREIVKEKSTPALRRCYSALAAGYIQDEALAKALRDVLADKDDKEVRSSACIALGNLKDASATPILGKILNPPEGTKKELTEIRAYAALGLGRIGGKEALAELKKCAASNEREIGVRTAVIVALGLLNMPEAKEPIVLFLQDKVPTVKGFAALSLGLLKDPKSYDLIAEAFQKNKSSDADGLMCLALGLTGNDKAKPDLRKIFENKKSRPLLKASAAIGLGLLKDTNSAPLMISILKDEKQQNDVILAPYLILSLGMIQDEKATEVLMKLWQKADKNLNFLAYSNLAVSLSMLGKRGEVIGQLANHANAKDNLLSSYALHTLGLVGDRDAAKILVDTFNSRDNAEVRRADVVAIGFLMDKNPINPLERINGDNIDIPMVIMNHILPIPVW